MAPGSAKNARAEFARLAMPHVDTMYAVALRMTGNEKDAEDLVQDAMLRSYRFFDKFTPGTNLKAWLIKVMTNIFLNRLKKTMRRPALLEFDSIEDLMGEIEEDWQAVSSSQEDFREYLDENVARALDELPCEYRIPVLLMAIDGFSYREIAEAMECPVGTVMSRLYRGRRMLERKLLSYARDHGYLRDRGAK